ncbi:DUF305 domain-containing protein [Aerosakkonema funiforme]|uniref:DUF305 domain-containing protein n=1 Tax=Aerosakkonema funiforme TaxID=1246630 RepID=UPI0035B767B5
MTTNTAKAALKPVGVLPKSIEKWLVSQVLLNYYLEGNEMKKFLTYSLIALMTSGAIATLSITNGANATEHRSMQAQTTPDMSSPSNQMDMMSEVDRVFIEMMIPHHQSANEMAEMALQHAENPEVKELAQKIIDEQSREIEQMQTWYRQWYGINVSTTNRTTSMQGMSQPMMMSMQQQEQMEQEMMAALENAENFDQEFLRQMTRHHQMATMMAGMVVDSAEHSETRELAQSIIESQSQEIAQMQQLLSRVARQ